MALFNFLNKFKDDSSTKNVRKYTSKKIKSDNLDKNDNSFLNEEPEGSQTDEIKKKQRILLDFIMAGELEEVKKILAKREFRLNFTDDNKNTPLHIATEYGYMSIVELLLRYRAYIDVINKDKRTPLIIAAYKSSLASEDNNKDKFRLYIKLAEKLIKSGADPKIRDINGNRFIEYIHPDLEHSFRKLSGLWENPFK